MIAAASKKAKQIRPRFREDKTTQAAAILLKLNGGQMNYMKLIKLLYIVDRQALLSWGRPVTYDTYVATDKGLVLNQTLSLINEGVEPGYECYWSKWISEIEHSSVKLLAECPTEELSEAEIELIHNVFDQYRHIDKWELSNIFHQFSEWQDPQGSVIPITYQDILRFNGKTDVEIAAIVDELESIAIVDQILSP